MGASHTHTNLFWATKNGFENGEFKFNKSKVTIKVFKG